MNVSHFICCKTLLLQKLKLSFFGQLKGWSVYGLMGSSGYSKYYSKIDMGLIPLLHCPTCTGCDPVVWALYVWCCSMSIGLHALNK